MPALVLPEQIRTPADIVRFFQYLDKVDRTSFHPDDPFFDKGEVQYTNRRGEPAYTPEEAKLRDRLMEQVWDVATEHNLDPSEVAIWVTDPNIPHRPGWVQRAMATGRKAWDPREGGPELGALPPARQAFQVGDLQFTVFAPKGLVTEIRVAARGSTKPFIVRPEPRLQPVELTLKRVLEDLYAMAQDPAKIRHLIFTMIDDPKEAMRTELMVRWAEEHRPQIVGAMARMMPAIVPFKRVP